MQFPSENLVRVQYFQKELRNILNYWQTNTIDDVNGGFIGQIDENENKIAEADKGAVLNARLLWTFSAAYNYEGNLEDLALAKRSYDYILAHFIDVEYGGVFWSLDFKGNPSNDKKQVYAIAFTIYGLAEYFKATKDKMVLERAISLFRDVEEHSYDPGYEGYLEAFTRNWKKIEDVRLSSKDQNDKKTMNTHLHILEAYTNLYSVWPDDFLKKQIRKLIDVFRNFILTDSNHLNLFFDADWHVKSNVISYGHDIEASWLLLEAAIAIEDYPLIFELEKRAVEIALSTAQGIDKDGGLNYELDLNIFHLDQDKHWWVQAEALVGFYNAWQISSDKLFKEQFEKILKFTETYIIDRVHNEWFWGVDAEHVLLPGQDKAGFWKCPYHNGRACLQLIQRLTQDA